MIARLTGRRPDVPSCRATAVQMDNCVAASYREDESPASRPDEHIALVTPADSRELFSFREPAVSVNHCGSCTLCCKVLGIAEINKPRNTWCPHCDKVKGCRIYDTPAKPKECTTYNCAWLGTQSLEDPTLRMPERFRPDRTKVVIDVHEHPNYRAAMFWIDLSYPDAINSEVNQTLIRKLSATHVVIEARGNKRKVLAIDAATAKRMVASGHTPRIGQEWAV